MKIQKKNGGGGGGSVGRGEGGQGGCERRIEVLGKIHQKNRGGGQMGGWVGGGVRVDVNAMLGVGGVGCVNQKWKVLYNVQKGIV